MTTLKQIVDAATEAKHYYWMEREDNPAPIVPDRAAAHRVWEYLYDEALHTTGAEHDNYQRAADRVGNEFIWWRD